MRYQAKAMHLSFLLHSALIFSVILLSRYAVPVKAPLVIDFTVETVNLRTEKPAESNAATLTSQILESGPLPSHPGLSGIISKISGKGAAASRIGIHHRKIVRQNKLAASPKPVNQLKTTAKDPVKNQAVFSNARPTLQEQKTPAAALPSDQPGAAGKNESNIQAGALAAGKDTVREYHPAANDKDADGMRNKERKYLRNNFAYIRNLIMRNLTFPTAARKMGWSGKMLVSFVIREDGTVEDIKIITGSGHEVLDTNVISAIHRTAPLPKPPAKAQLLLPIVYSLK